MRNSSTTVKREPGIRYALEEREPSEFVHKGAIVRMRIRNFMTYTDVEIKPGPNLNMILGPNGTGKSAIVCCIIIGLAGEVTLTGRGGSPADFVKKNTDCAITEIELFNDEGRNFIIERKIIITNRSQAKIDHRSEWRINGRTCNKNDIVKLTKEFNIKVDNLCQFLPQDSVTQFVKMNNWELLVNTLKAAGDNQLVDDHQKLISLSKEVKEKRFALENLTQAFKENEINAKRLESEVRQLRQRDELVNQRKTCHQKIIYVKFCEEEAKCDAAEEEREKRKRDLIEMQDRTEPLLHEIDCCKAKVSEYKQCLIQSESEVKKASSDIQKMQDTVKALEADCQGEFAKFRSKEMQEQERESYMQLKLQELDSLECKLDETRDVDCSREIKKVEKEVEAIRAERMKCIKVKHHNEEIVRRNTTSIDQIKRDIEQIIAVKEKKNYLLRTRFPDIFKVLEWLSRNKNRFKRHIFTPIFCEINVKDAKFSSIIEHAISTQELISFVCQTEEDLKLFTRSVRDELNIRFNVILAPEKTLEEFEFEASQCEDFSNMGLKYRLKDLIDAPEPIMRFLCGTLGFHKIPVSEGCSESQLKELLQRCPKFFVGNTFYSVSRSRYDNKCITVSDTVRDPQLLVHSLDIKKLRENKALLDRLQTEADQATVDRTASMAREDTLREEWQALASKHRELKLKHDEKRKLETLIERLKVYIEKSKAEKIDIEGERRKLQQSIEKINRQIMGGLDKLVELYRRSVKVKELLMSNLLLLKLAELNHQAAQKRYTGTQRETSLLAEEIRLKGRELEQMRHKLEALRKEVKQRISGFRKGKLDPITQKRFDTITENSREGLQMKVEELTARIQMIYNDTSNSIMNEYTRQTEELNDKRIRMQELESRVNEIDRLVTDIKSDWMPKLHDVINVIDKNYKDFMRKLRYDGHVKLDYDPSKPDNFSDYGIKILVKYRDSEQLIPLSSTRQSGGERSVATMIYMLALQTKTSVPFRCVDEINQGMDQENERKVFELLVHTADTSSSQYFLVSPKLLSNLPYSEKMKIHIVFNGKKLDLSWGDEEY